MSEAFSENYKNNFSVKGVDGKEYRNLDVLPDLPWNEFMKSE